MARPAEVRRRFLAALLAELRVVCQYCPVSSGHSWR